MKTLKYIIVFKFVFKLYTHIPAGKKYFKWLFFNTCIFRDGSYMSQFDWSCIYTDRGS